VPADRRVPANRRAVHARRYRSRRRVALALGVSLLILTGCGGGDEAPPVSDQDRAALERLSSQIVTSARERDAESFCAIVQPSLLEDAFGGERGCRSLIRRALNQNARVLTDLDVERVTVQDEGAIVTYAQDPPGDVLFVREQGQWYLALNELAETRAGARGQNRAQQEGSDASGP
jgi:hypothetical protein